MQCCGKPSPVYLINSVTASPLDLRPSLRALVGAANRNPDGFDDFWSHPETWQIAREMYRKCLDGESFIDVWWNFRFMMRPLWRIAATVGTLPKAAVYHSVSTGYAGLLACLGAEKFEAKFLLSEHGIYVRERIADLLRSDCTPCKDTPIDDPSIRAIRELWIGKFIEIGRVAYLGADQIVSLFQKNADYQIEFGASSNKITIIPNGVDLDKLETPQAKRREIRRRHPQRRHVGFLGRIVAVKDLKTLLRAAAAVVTDFPDAQFLIIGPTDEDDGYAEQCRELCRQLGIVERVEFTGPKSIDEALPDIDVMVLSSISEGLPFVALEAFAAEIPLVATDVGACRELIEGRSHRHARGGPAGFVVPVAQPVALAKAISRLLADRSLQDQFGAAGRRRVETVYAQADVIAAYRRLYDSLSKNTLRKSDSVPVTPDP